MLKIAYLGPAGTFTEDALRGGGRAGAEFEPLRTPTIHEAILAVERGEAERALVPFENSIEGSVRSTLDTLAFDAEEVTIVGEHDFAVRAMLIARERHRSWSRSRPCSRTPSRWPSARASCATSLPGRRAARVRAPPRRCGWSASPSEPWAAIGARAAAELYGCTILREGIEDEANNVTRFVWIAPAGTEPSGGGRLEDLARLLRAGRRPSRRPGQRPARVLQPRGQPDPDRVAAAAPRIGPLHVLLRPRGGAHRGTPSPRRSRPCEARQNRSESWAPTRNCVEFPSNMARVARTQRNV